MKRELSLNSTAAQLFRRYLEEGYEKVEIGSGIWVGDSRITAIWAFTHPSGKIAAVCRAKLDYGGFSCRPNKIELFYDRDTFEAFVKKHQLHFFRIADLENYVEEVSSRHEATP